MLDCAGAQVLEFRFKSTVSTDVKESKNIGSIVQSERSSKDWVNLVRIVQHPNRLLDDGPSESELFKPEYYLAVCNSEHSLTVEEFILLNRDQYS